MDLDQRYPGVAQRLGLPLYPNLHTAVDAAHHEPDRLDSIVQSLGRLGVIGGVARPDPQRTIPAYEIAALIDDVATVNDCVVADLGTSTDGLQADATIIVGEGTPVGLERLIRAVEGHEGPGNGLLALVNRVRRGGRMSDEIREELRFALPEVTVFLVAEDDRVPKAAWDGVVVGRGPFVRALSELARVLQFGGEHDS